MLVFVACICSGSLGASLGYLGGREYRRTSRESDLPPGLRRSLPPAAAPGTGLSGWVPDTGTLGPRSSPAPRSRPEQFEHSRGFELPATSPYKLVYTGMGAGKIPSML